MKHHLRKENNCLNCGAIVNGRFCSNCGQENLDTRESFGHLLSHFFADVTHYDSKFLTTIKYLLFKPGFLSRQYFAGKRTAYLNPLRMYFFISFIFFFVLSLAKSNEPETTNDDNKAQYNILKQELADSIQANAKNSSDSTKAVVMNDLAAELHASVAATKDTTETINFGFGNNGVQVTLKEGRYNTVQEYDSVQQTLPGNKKDAGILHWLIRTNIKLKSEYGSRSNVVVAENFEHSIPKLMFVLLPLFAWFLYIFHSRKNFYYAQHAIFSVHFHSFMFLLLLVLSLLKWIMPFDISSYAALLCVLIAFIYLAVALKNAFHQSIWMASLKALCVGLFYIIVLVLGILALAFISFVTA
ncbi:MAG: DUF3667 domain-containing protein [Parafilimonas sp.]|nr:DUF3667 domain-containing protein [Parafilimonas sp.]